MFMYSRNFVIKYILQINKIHRNINILMFVFDTNMHRYFRTFVNHAHKPDNIWRNEIDVRPQNQQDTIYNILRGIERLGYVA